MNVRTPPTLSSQRRVFVLAGAKVAAFAGGILQRDSRVREEEKSPAVIIAAGLVFLTMTTKLHIGVDFGYGYTGLAVLAPGTNARLRVIKHRQDISKTLLQRRENRAARRRNKTRAARLRNFRTLLAGICLSPRKLPAKNGGTKPDADFIGNKLYALAHRRGWDYSTLTELLIKEDGGATPVVREINELLMDKYGAEPREEIRRFRGKKRVRRILVAGGEDQTCLGELAQLRADIGKLELQLQKTEQPEKAEYLAEQLAQAESEFVALAEFLENADRDKIERYLNRRLEVCGIAREKREAAAGEIIVRLGLDSGEELHKSGVLYAPHRNRHRDEFVKELRKMLEDALDAKSGIPQARAKLAENAEKRKMPVAEAKALWIKNAIAVMDPNNPGRTKNKGKRRRIRDIRPPRFENRRIGKCPAKIPDGEKRACALSQKLAKADGERCWANLPKKANVNIRRLQFETEARQMNVKGGDDGERKLTDGEVAELMACVDWRRGQNGKAKPKVDNARWKAFFAKHKTPPVKDDARGKKDILRDIAEGAQGGRAALCQMHLRQKLQLIKAGQTESEQWQNLHGERRLNIYDNDGAPSVRQKVQKVIGILKAMLKESGCAKTPIGHIGIETARFDISALAQNEGKKMKSAKSYQRKSGRGIDDMRRQQGDRCFYCGHPFFGGDITVDHVVAKARRGGDRELNRVAAHLLCNINKGKGMARSNEEVLRQMENGDEDARRKAAHIRKIIKDGGAARGDSLAGAQHTMLGAKLLKGSLMSAFGIKADAAAAAIFPPINPREVSYLRRAWFPLMDEQKRDMRRAAREGKTSEHLGRPIETFHHAIDALVCAAKADWQKLMRMDGGLTPGDDEYRRRFAKNAKAEMPRVSLPVVNIGGAEYHTAPEKRAFLIEDKGRKDGTRRAKTGREPLNLQNKTQVRQRKALYAIARRNVKNIVSPRMRELMEAAFADIGKMRKEEQDKFLQKDGCIAKEYFLALPKNKPLHPKNARGALCKVGGTGPEQMWAVVDKKGKAPGGKKGGARHYFKREVAWRCAVVYELADDSGKKKPKRHLLTVPDEFYRNRANAALFAELPKGAKEVARFCRGDIVTVADMRGRWKIAEVHKGRAVLNPRDDAARDECGGKTEMDKSYNKLTKTPAKKRQKPPR